MMISEVDTALTLGGFVALASLGIAAVSMALNATGKNADMREKIARLETRLEEHLRNGGHHAR